MDWGDEWGDDWGLGVNSQGVIDGAKEDTVFLALSGALTTDHSQYGTNLTAIGAGAFETNSGRTELDEEWEVYVRCVLTAGEADKVLIAVHNADLSTIAFALRTSAGGTFGAMLGSPGADVWKGPAVPAGDISFAWHMRVNPDSTGSSDARISELIVYDHTAGAYLAIEKATHAAPTAAATHTLSVGGAYFAAGPTLINAPTTPPSKARVSRSCHNAAEFADDWVAEKSAHTHTLERLIEPIGVGLDAGGVGQWAGQANVGFAAAHANALRGRMLTPMLKEFYPDARTLTTTPDPTQWIIGSPGDSTYKMDATLLRWLPCEGWSYAQVYVQVQSWITAGDPVPVGIRCYTMSRPHVGLGWKLGDYPMPPLEYFFGEQVITEDHTSSGEGEWLDLGVIKLPMLGGTIPGWSGSVGFGLSYAFDPAAASGNDANARLRIKGWSVLPVVGEP